jgi:hypothetical protein
MSSVAYLFFVFVACIFGALLGFVGHFARAHFTYEPEDLGLGEPWESLFRDGYNFEKNIVGAKWDDNGFWDAESNRNLLYYIGCGFVAPLIFGFAFWSERVAVVTSVCDGLFAVGLTPLVCP